MYIYLLDNYQFFFTITLFFRVHTTRGIFAVSFATINTQLLAMLLEKLTTV